MNIYVIYLALQEDGNVLFSKTYSSFNLAKSNIDSFVEQYCNKLGKKMETVSESKLEQIKMEKMPEDCIYVRKRTSEATLYCRRTFEGRIYNSYLIEKYGTIGISEFAITDEQEKSSVEEGIENLSHGVHVTFISELKDALLNRRDVPKIEIRKKEQEINPFLKELIEGKKFLRNITPLPPRKLIIDDIYGDNLGSSLETI